jgi:hypothetical protein
MSFVRMRQTRFAAQKRNITGKAASIHQVWPSVQLKLLPLNKTTSASIVPTDAVRPIS